MKRSNLFLRETLLPLVPLLVLYLIIILYFGTDILAGDEIRHWNYAQNLTEGFYTPRDNPEIRNGPGYPIILAILMMGDVPVVALKMLNALFLFLAVILFYKSISTFLNDKYTLIAAYVFGLYPPFLKWLIGLNSEALAIFLAMGFLYYFLETHREPGKLKSIALASIFLGSLALTKVIFGYVILGASILYALGFLFQRTRKSKHTLIMLGGGFLFCVPFLIYTYSLTGKILYWGTGGGEILYWRSSPFVNEFGDWISADVVLGKQPNDLFEFSSVANNHREFLENIVPLPYVERDEIYKEKALENMRLYPLKYFKNTVASGFRLFFNYPYSYTRQKLSSYFYILPNGLLLLSMIISTYLFFRKPKRVPFEIRFMGVFALITIGGLILANGLVRYLLPIIPFIGLFVIAVIGKELGKVQPTLEQ